MANREFFYFYTPTWDYPPEGPIKLGNVITTVKKPHIPLINCPLTEDAGIYKTVKRKVQYTKDKLRSGQFSILTKFLSVLGFGVDVGVEVERRFVQSFLQWFDKLTVTVTRKAFRLTLWKPLNSSLQQNICSVVLSLKPFVDGWRDLAILSLFMSLLG
jgi:hypothetical protein